MAPREGAELGQASKVAPIEGDQADSGARDRHREERIVGETRLANLFIAISGSEACENFAGLGPVGEVGDQDAASTMEVALETLDGAAIACRRSGIEFFEHHRAEPNGRPGGEIPKQQSCVVRGTQGRDVNRSVEQDPAQSILESPVDVFDPDAGRKEARVGQSGQAVSFKFAYRQVQGPFDGFRFGFGAENALRSPDLCGVQPVMLV